MRNTSKRPLHLLMWLALLPALAGCASYPGPPYPYAVITGGGPDGWPAWVEELRFDDAWGPPVGGVGGDISWEEPPIRGGTAIMGPRAIPQTMSARWFSHRTLTFYEIDLAFPEDTEKRVRAFYRDHPPPEYTHDLMVGISGDGRVRVWWRAWCGRDCGEDHAYLPIIRETVGRQVEGDPEQYRESTEYHRELGRIPPEPEPPPR
ncbi:MAG: DUF2931 family protein [Ectothiorhodospiraceae bacterium]|nr:DUF2931 family protein [Ectothiorhodospiraceae bacterium]